MSFAYVEPILRHAVDRVMVGAGSLPVRIAQAFGLVHPVVTTQLTGRAEELRGQLMADYATVHEGHGGAASTLQAMHHTRRKAIAKNLLDLYVAVVTARSSGSASILREGVP